MKLFNDLFFRKSFNSVPLSPAPFNYRLWHIQGARERWLSVDSDGRVISQPECNKQAVLLCEPTGGPQSSFLFAADIQKISIEGDGMIGLALSARLLRVKGGHVELRHPVAPMRYLGLVFGASNRPDRVLFDRVGDKTLDRFKLNEATDIDLRPPARALLAECVRCSAPPATADRLIAMLKADQLRHELAETIARALPPDELLALARRLLTDLDLLGLFQAVLPNDPWLARAMPALLAWERQDRRAPRRTVSPANDEHVTVLHTARARPQLGFALNSMARRTVSPRRGSAILATARNEGAYLLHWIAHHRSAGFERIFIYSNQNDDGSDQLLARLADADAITWIRSELDIASRPRFKAYGHAFQMLPDILDFRWVMVLDLDEYVGFDRSMFASIGEAIGWHEHQRVDAVALRRLNFVALPGDVYHDAPSTQRFTMRQPDVIPQFKTLLRPQLFWDSHTHFPFSALDLPFTFRLEDGSVCQHPNNARGLAVSKEQVTADRLWVAHHAFRTAGEALMKVSRGNATWRADEQRDVERLDDIVHRCVVMANRSGLISDVRTRDCVPGVETETARLLSLPGVQVVDEEVKRRFSTSVRCVSEVFARSSSLPGQNASFSAMRTMLQQEQ